MSHEQITDDTFDPEYHGGCIQCDKLDRQEELFYDEHTGEYVCSSCYLIEFIEANHNYAYEQSMKVLS